MTAGLAMASLVVAAAAGVRVARGRRMGLGERIRPYRASGPRAPADRTPATGALWSAARPAGLRLWRERVRSTRLEARLRAAGRPASAAAAFRERQWAHTGTGAGAGVILGAVVLHSTTMGALLAVVGGLVGCTRAPSQLARLAEERRTRMRLELVTVDQLLAIHVRAGAGPVQAIMRVVARGDGVVVDELRAIVSSIRAGRSEADAFRHAAGETAEPHAARTYRLFALAAEQGADLGEALRALSDDLRDVRRNELRRQAVRRRAAMLVPTIAVLAPIMLLFV
ncbi:MAG: type II secretion system F family protein, partial [Actinomycetota bacterium]